MIIFLLVVTIYSGTGSAREPLQLGGKKAYYTLKDCQEDGLTMVNWLTQPDVVVEATCERVERRAIKAQEGLG